MIIIKCVKCKRKIFKYKKIGKGKILYCWYDRIKEDYSIRKEGKVFCECGNLIGVEKENHVKMKQRAFIYTGAIERK